MIIGRKAAGPRPEETKVVANMNDEFLRSSDTGRGSGPLKHAKSVTFDGPLELERGRQLPGVTVVYETYGQLTEACDNVVLICHTLSGDSHVAAHDENDDPGWWDLAVGPGKAIDTDRYFVLCPNILGGCHGTTGPHSIDPATGEPYGADFPTITIGDMVEVQRMLLDELGIGRLLAVVGGSLGGPQAIQWAIRYPDRAMGVIVIASSPRLSSQAMAFDVVGRNAILRDPNFRGGQYYGAENGPDVGLAIARMIAHITYLSPEAMQDKFQADRCQPHDVSIHFEKEFSVGTYLGYQGTKFVERFDANSYVTLSMAMDLFDLGGTAEQLLPVFQQSQSRWLIISFTTDWLYSPAESRQMVDALVAANKPVSYCNVASNCGHDAFLLPEDLPAYGGLTSGFLANLSGERQARPEAPAAQDHSPTSIFHPAHPQRLDYDMICELIDAGSSVLDLGCGAGRLLGRLFARGHGRIMGVELSEQAIIDCVRSGFDVVHADLNDGLGFFADKQFDYVVLSQTLQAIKDVERVIDDILRVGKRCIVSFPNFAYHKLRKMLFEQGRAPESAGLLRYQWYNTPNIRFLSIADFEAYCAEKDIAIHKSVALDTEAGREITEDPNLNADLAMVVISR